MTVREYNELLERVTLLDDQDKKNLLVDLAALIRDTGSPRKQRSIMELEGLGKEIWQGIDAQEYVDKERDSWNG